MTTQLGTGATATAKKPPFTERDACQWTGRSGATDEKLVAKVVTLGEQRRLVVQRKADGSEVWSRPLSKNWYGSSAFSDDGHYFVYQYAEGVA
ncbi:hypothetical protein QWT45_29870, partial [Escherichia coli]|uniref:hypothetical protein n=1 Tax=Escherichia coli TaxID=562 RepID=UPI002A7F9584